MRLALALALVVTALGCKAEPKQAPAPAKAPAAATSKPASAATRPTPPKPPPEPSKTVVLTDAQKAALDEGPGANMGPFEGKWVEVKPKDGGWVIEEPCDAATPTLTFDLSPEQPSFHEVLGQEGETTSFDFAVALDDRTSLVLERTKDGSYQELMRLQLVNDGEILRRSRPGGEASYYVPEAKRSKLPVDKEACETP